MLGQWRYNVLTQHRQSGRDELDVAEGDLGQQFEHGRQVDALVKIHTLSHRAKQEEDRLQQLINYTAFVSAI